MRVSGMLEDASDVLGVLAEDLQLLARLHDREVDRETLAVLNAIGFPNNLGLSMDDERSSDACLLLSQSLPQLAKGDVAHIDELAVDYASIYLNNSIQASPFESVWLDEDGLAMQEPMFQIRGWYEKYELQAENWRVRSDDHLALQLQFVAVLLTRGRGSDDQVALLNDAARFLDEHVLRWIDEFALRVAQRCDMAFYAGAALLTASYLQALRDELAGLLSEPRPSAEEIELRMNPKPEPLEVPLHYLPGTSPSW